jgi:hypothetical protein
MPIVSWKVMLRRANQEDYHYSATEQRDGLPSWGSKSSLLSRGRRSNGPIVEIFKDHSTRQGIDVFIEGGRDKDHFRMNDTDQHHQKRCPTHQ